MTLEELIAKVPAEARTAATLYGPTILQMAAADCQKWLDYILLGDFIAAYKLYLQAAETDLLAAWAAKDREWAEKNDANAKRRELQVKIAEAFASALLPVFLTMVGL